jgi:hypothetical protein
VGELVGGGRDLRADDVEHRERIYNQEVRSQKSEAENINLLAPEF